jgi:ATP-dependent RNA helicase DeaD
MNRFEELGIDSKIVKAITELGFENPMPIQEQAIPVLLEGNRDMVGLAQTGTGKTAAFGLPMAHLVDFRKGETQGLILCPTRELCLQITKDLQSFTKYLPGANIVAIYGGASIDNQIRELKRGAQIIVATPGRMLDVIERKKVNLSTVRFAVLDEADEMLNMGFKEDINEILSNTPDTKNTWLFSATMPADVARIAKNFMSNPHEITVGSKNQGAKNIEHHYYVVHARDKYAALKRIADYNPDIFGIVFCRTKIETQQIAEQLIKDGYNADSLHGDLSQQQRDKVMARYRSRSLQMLVATDVAARGIDVDSVTHVINYNLPDDIENYTHRSGRTARAGKSGVSLIIINMKEVYKIRQIEKQIGKQFIASKVPTGYEVCEKQLFHLVKKVHDVEVNEKEIGSYLPKIYSMMEDISKEDLIKRFVSIEFNRFLEYYKKAPDLNTDVRHDREKSSKEGRGAESRSNKLFINLGEMDGLDKNTLLQYISETSTLDQSNIGRIDVKSSFSFFEVDPGVLDIVVNAFKNQRFNSRNVRIEFSGNGQGGGSKRSYGGGDNKSSRSYGKSSGGNAYRGGSREGKSPRKRTSREYGKSGSNSYGKKN